MSYNVTTTFEPTKADAFSADTTVTALANGATEVVGNTVAVITHMALRFDTSSIPDDADIYGARLVMQSGAVVGTPVDIDLWASDFDTDSVRYNVPRNNHRSPIRVKIGTMFEAADVIGDAKEMWIPARFITAEGFTDFELRPLSPATSGTNTRAIVGQTATAGVPAHSAVFNAVDIDGSTYTAVTTARPRLYVYYFRPSVSGTATSATTTTLVDTALAMATNEYAGGELRITYGTGFGQVAKIMSNTATAFTVAPDWPITPDTTSQYIAELNIPEPCSPGVGAEAYVAFEIENDCGTPVKAKYLLDLNSTDLDSYAENIPSRSLRQERSAPAKLAVGRAGAGGSINFDVTVEKWSKMLLGFFKRVNTVDDSGNSNDGVVDIRTGAATNSVAPSVAPYWHTFKVASSSELQLATFVQKTTEGSRFVYPGCMFDSLSFSVGLDNLVEATASVMGLYEAGYDDNAAGEDDVYLLNTAAAYDLNNPLSFVNGEIEFNNRVQTGIQNLNMSLSNGVGESRGIRRNRAVRSHFPTKFSVGISFDIDFDSFAQLKVFLGDDSKKYPFTAKNKIVFDAANIKLGGEQNDDGTYDNEFVFRFPKLEYTVIRKPVSGEGVIRLNCQAIATLDTTSEGSMVLFVRDSQPVSFWSPSTEEITVLPEGIKYTVVS